MAFKMATGSGKTVVMAMLIAWQTLNKLANPQDTRFSDTFLIVTPGITIRDRLRVLLPNDPDNYYRQRDIVPARPCCEQLGQAKIIITNYHAFQLREKVSRRQADQGDPRPRHDRRLHRNARPDGAPRLPRARHQEEHHRPQRRSPSLLPRASRPTRPKTRNYRRRRKEAKKRDEEARIWISGIEAVKAKIGVKAIYDLSATPFFLRGSGYPKARCSRGSSPTSR